MVPALFCEIPPRSEVPPMKTVAGVPARVVGEAGCSQPSVRMDHLFGEGFEG